MIIICWLEHWIIIPPTGNRKYEKLSLININTGNILWSVQRDKFYKDNQNIIVTDKVIVIKGTNSKDTKTRYYILDINSGRQLWEYESRNKITYTLLNPSNNELIIVSGDKENLTVSGFNLTDRNNTWVTSIPEFRLEKKEIPKT